MKASRSGINLENLQEVLDAEDSAKWATLGNAQQYFSPEALVQEGAKYLTNKEPKTIFDPQMGMGNLLTYAGWRPDKYGIDIDARSSGVAGVNVIRANCV